MRCATSAAISLSLLMVLQGQRCPTAASAMQHWASLRGAAGARGTAVCVLCDVKCVCAVP